MKWVRDPKVESHLKNDLGVEFKVELGVKIDWIDLKESLERQVRVGEKLDDNLVLEYAEAQNAGADFPMPILNRLPNQRLFWIWSGNHRIAAANLRGEKEIDAYVLQVTDPRMMDLIPRVVNTWEGKRTTREEMLIHAAWLIETHSWDTKDVAKKMSLRPDHITAYMRTQRVATQIRDEGVNADGFSKTLLLRMAPIADNRNVLRELSKCLKKNDCEFNEAEQIITDVKGGNTEHERLEIIRGWNKTFADREEKHKLPIKTSQRSRFLSLLGNMRNLLLNSRRFTELQLSPADYENVFQQWKDCEDSMRRLMKEGGVK